tara:strand:- start:3659 stop:4558 length:900 start_codon:yes stop_codon:yes gene_type:complete
MKILAINYSQSGQLNSIIHNFIRPLHKEHDIDRIIFKPKKDFPFPWTSDIFFNTMPESVLEEKVALEKINYKYEKYDLIILGYQPWYLSPSIPTSSLLQDENFRKLLPNTKVITIIGSRNMWLNSQESIKKSLSKGQAELIANIVLSDKTNNQVSAITILYWMLTTKKEKFLNIFPKPGVSNEDISKIEQQGILLQNEIGTNDLNNIQEKFERNIPTIIPNDILFIEERAIKLFKMWAKLIKSKRKTRKLWVTIYKYYLLIALFIIAPIVIFFVNIFIFPFTKNYLKTKKQYFRGIQLK